MTSKTMTRNDFLRISAGFVCTSTVSLGFGCGSDDSGEEGADSGNAPTTGDATTSGPEGSTTGTPGTTTTTEPGTSGSTTAVDSSSSGEPGTTTTAESTSEPGGCTMDPDVTIGTNHGHELVVPLADVMAAADVMYNIQGTSMHNHTVLVTAGDFMMLAQGMQVMITSSTDNMHSHEVALICGA